MQSIHWFKLTSITLILLLVFLYSPTATAQPPPTSQETDWTIEQDTHLVDQEKRIEGNLTVLGNTTLRLEGTHLQVGGRLLVDPEASLVLSSSSMGPSSLSAAHSDSSFWMQIQGELRTKGTGPHVIKGLHGVGLASAFGEGGLRIEGQAYLRDIHILDGLAGVIVMQEGTLDLQEAVVSGLGEVGLMVLGTMDAQNVIIEETNMGIIARAPCNVSVSETKITSKMTTVFVNGCPVQVTDSLLEGGHSGVGANNEAVLEVRSSLIRNYTQQGLSSYAYPDEDGGMRRPMIVFHDVTFEPASQAQRGTDLRGLSLGEFYNVTVQGHQEHGIKAQSSSLFIEGSTIQGNGGHAIELAGGHFLNDPLASGNLFGTPLDGKANTEGAISHVVIARLNVVDESEALIPGEISLDVYRTETGDDIEVFTTENDGSGTIQIMFEAFGTDPEGNPEYLGPFGYEAIHPAGHEEWAGELHPEDGTILLFLAADSVEAEPLPVMSFWGLIVVIFGALFALSETRKRDR